MFSRSSSRRGARVLSLSVGLALVATPLAVVAAPAQAADPVVLNLLGVNDFHGRINSTTVQWAGTVEQLRQAGGADNTLMVGAGDLIGASEFASSVQQDQPTIDMFNALGLNASAVGNHEFDKGYADLTDRVIGSDGARNAQWDYLGANVYEKGTTTPALPEYAEFEVAGIDVAVVGAVTEETSSLVSPGGISQIDFGDPIDAVNRVAGELSDGDDSNGEAQVIIASFHSGAEVGAGSTYDAEVAKGGEFAEMANLDPSVDVIFNGHTHQTYAWDAPIPGGGGATRPIVQTGSYGANVGQVSLTVDPVTGDVSAYTATNVARTTTPAADLVAAYPDVAQVKTIVDDATAYAATIGNQPVSEITGNITTAFTGGSYANGTYVGGTRDDRGSESTLGDLVGNALRDGIPADQGTADLGITNPGGLRADLLYAGDTATNPDNTDGVVTYAEANGVLPFVNNVWLVRLSGAALTSVLEQQWQPAGASRPFLALGLSDNVQVVYDPDAEAGSHVTSVTIDGKALDPSATYTVSTFSFLGTGGDNFTAFTQGTPKDTGLVDRDLWISYLTDQAPFEPDFARQQVAATGLPTGPVSAGDDVAIELSKLDLTSLGSPQNTTVEATHVVDGTSTPLGSFPVTDGAASVAFTVPDDVSGGTIEMVAQPSGTTVSVPVTVQKVSSTLSAKVTAIDYGQVAKVTVKVTSSVPATGAVQVLKGRTVLATGTVKAGSATIALPRASVKPGRTPLTVKYAGDDQVSPSSTTTILRVSKASPRLVLKVSPSRVVAGRTKPVVTVRVKAAGFTPSGKVQVKAGGERYLATVRNGTAKVKLAKFSSAGRKTVVVTYLGTATTKAARDTIKVKVRRR